MTMTLSQTAPTEATYGWLADAIGGVATVVLAIIGLAGGHSATMLAIASIVFGAALLIEGGTMVTEYAHMAFPAETVGTVSHKRSIGSFTAVFAAGAAGIALGILAILGVRPAPLTAIAAIVFGSALLFSGNAGWHLHTLRRAALPAREWRSGTEILAGEMVQGSSGMQALAGVAAMVLGILALTLPGTGSGVLTLSALVVLGAALLLTGSAATEFVWGVMRNETRLTSFGAAE